jgi:uncharacterized protein YndB with AHSA1/START domain
MIGLRIDRTFPAPRQRVWRALTEAEAFAAWFWPVHFATEVEMDARPGGGFRVSAPGAPGGGLAVSGTYQEVEPPCRLVFTWRWDGEEEETRVTIELSDAGDGTALALVHEGFAADSTRDAHHIGWTDCLDRLPTWLAAASAA